MEEAVDTGGVAPNAQSKRSSRSRLGIGGVLAIAAMAASFALTRSSSTPKAGPSASLDATVKAAVDKATKAAAAGPARSAVVYQTILPSLVFISTDQAAEPSSSKGVSTSEVPQSTVPDTPQSTVPDTIAAPGAQTTKPPAKPDAKADDRGGIGAGVIINADGSILTARHIVANAGVITVTFADGTRSTAKIVSQNPSQDTAVILADRPPSVIVPAVLGGSVRVGDEAYAVGHPLGLVDSLSAGVISGLNRSIPVEEAGITLDGLIQFDAAVNPGNSGGPLLNRNGQVVGIVTALANPAQQGFFVGIGFAVPIATAGGGAGAPPQ